MTVKIPSTLLNIETPPQFDNTLTAVNSAFVQRSLGNFSGARFISTNTTLTLSDVGSFIAVGSGATITLPARSSIVAGARIEIRGTDLSDITIQCAGTDNLIIGATTPTSVLIPGTSSIILTADVNPTMWNTGGTSMLKYDALFSNGKTTNGYQKFPSGLIIQWGTGTSSGTGQNNGTVTLPIAFPTVGIRGYSVPYITGAATFTTQTGNTTTTTQPITTLQNGSITTAISFRWISLGY